MPLMESKLGGREWLDLLGKCLIMVVVGILSSMPVLFLPASDAIL